MKTMTERHSYILEQLRKVGYVRVVDLADELGVSTAMKRLILIAIVALSAVTVSAQHLAHRTGKLDQFDFKL